MLWKHRVSKQENRCPRCCVDLSHLSKHSHFQMQPVHHTSIPTCSGSEPAKMTWKHWKLMACLQLMRGHSGCRCGKNLSRGQFPIWIHSSSSSLFQNHNKRPLWIQYTNSCSWGCASPIPHSGFHKGVGFAPMVHSIFLCKLSVVIIKHLGEGGACDRGRCVVI